MASRKEWHDARCGDYPAGTRRPQPFVLGRREWESRSTGRCRGHGRHSKRLGHFEHQIRFPNVHPSTNFGGSGRSLGSPAVPRQRPSSPIVRSRFAQTSLVAESAEIGLRLPGRHAVLGGDRGQKVRSLGRVLVLSSENGPTSPGRWQPAQFFHKIGAMCFVYVTCGTGDDGVAATTAASNNMELDMTATSLGRHFPDGLSLKPIQAQNSRHSSGRSATQPSRRPHCCSALTC